MPRPLFIPGLCFLALFLAPAASADLFEVRVSGQQDSFAVTGKSVFDLADTLSNRQGEFATLEGQTFSAGLSYANLNDALLVSSNANNTAIRLQIPSISFDRTFEDGPAGSAEDQLTDFLRRDGAATVSRFLRVVNTQTLVGVTDGNPAALTALLANDGFRNFGTRTNPWHVRPQGLSPLRLYGSYAALRTDAGDGYLIESALSAGLRVTDRVGIVASFPGSLRDIEGSQTFTVGATLGVPVGIVGTGGGSWNWQITPHATVAGGGSQDQLAGGIIYGGGLTNLVSKRVGMVTFSSGQQIVFYEGTPVEVSDYRFETDVSQQVGKVSFAAGLFDSPGSRGYVQAGLTYTHFFSDSAVDGYLTPALSGGLRLGSRSVLRGSLGVDIADGFDAYRGEVELRIAL